MIETIGIGIALIGLIVLCVVAKKQKNKKEKALLASNKMREEALDKLLFNQEAAVKKEEDTTFAAVPINVNYDVNALDKSIAKTVGKKKNKSKKMMIQIVENSELSVRKYMFDPKKSIFIGSKNGKNHIVNSSVTVDERQCEIKGVQEKVYVRNMGEPGKIILTRGKQIAHIEHNYIELKNGDIISIANTTYQIDIIATNEM
ncbi:MAG: FHA domain-containing protein [Lachnospiraceae bacterium]|nr:FHA domain-containing protein [Lachnospiraceae bacterium]